jgi:glycosyltransferase involved in cell wall biosynthesis
MTAATPGAELRDRVRDTVGRAAQGARYLLRTRVWGDAIAHELAPGMVATGMVATAATPATSATPPPFDIWQSEGLVMLPVALRLQRLLGGRVVYDSRDISLESGRYVRLPRMWRQLLARRERAWARAADAIVTVNQPYADHLRRLFGREPLIVYNGPLPFDPPDPPQRRFHARLDLPRIEADARSLPHGGRILFLPGIPPDELLYWTAAADVAVMPIQPSTLNHRLTTPTRLFDAMGAGIPVVASDLPGMAEIVRETGIGVLVDPTSAESVAAGIREILDASPEQRAAYRAASLAAARGRYAWASGVTRLLELYRELAPVG